MVSVQRFTQSRPVTHNRCGARHSSANRLPLEWRFSTTGPFGLPERSTRPQSTHSSTSPEPEKSVLDALRSARYGRCGSPRSPGFRSGPCPGTCTATVLPRLTDGDPLTCVPIRPAEPPRFVMNVHRPGCLPTAGQITTDNTAIKRSSAPGGYRHGSNWHSALPMRNTVRRASGHSSETSKSHYP